MTAFMLSIFVIDTPLFPMFIWEREGLVLRDWIFCIPGCPEKFLIARAGWENALAHFPFSACHLINTTIVLQFLAKYMLTSLNFYWNIKWKLYFKLLYLCCCNYFNIKKRKDEGQKNSNDGG